MNDIDQVIDRLDWQGNIASPSPEFWNLWRADKNAVKDAGYGCRPGANGWEVFRKGGPRAPRVIYPTLVEMNPTDEAPSVAPADTGRRARCVDGFSPDPIPTTRRWSDEQLSIFSEYRTGTGNVIVDAKAGTGKTTTTKVGMEQAPEEEQLYAVFGTRNKEEAANTITDPRVTVSTLHAAGRRLIAMVWRNIRPDNRVEVDRVVAILGKNQPDDAYNAVEQLVAYAKNVFPHIPSVHDLEQLAEDYDVEVCDVPGWNQSRLAAAALDVMKLSLQRDPEGRISFNDMVWLPVAANWVRPLYDLVVVDEAQDMNMPQLLMCIGLCRPGGRIFVIGDPRQAIYAFRGAAADGMGMMRERLNAKTLTLSVTYRCPKSVVAIAAEIVPGYQAHESAPEGIVRSMGDGLLIDTLQIGDAVLSRANAPLMPICLKLLRKGIPAAIRGKDIGKTLIGIAKKLNAKSIPHFMARVEAWADKQKSRFKADKNYEAKCDLVNDQAGCLKSIAENLTSVSEIAPRIESMFLDDKGFNKPTVVLSSVHKAKGLEWNRVFLIAKTFRVTKGQDEEANIYYVAVTRAKQELVFVSEDKPRDN